MLRLLAALLVLAHSAPAGAQDLRLFSVGSGEVGGSYFAATNAICNSLNRAHRGVLRCSPEATPGSLYNLEALRSYQLDFAMVQSDWQKAAYEGTDIYAAAGPMTNLTSVMSLYPESITVLARSGSGITQIADILGKRIDIGPPASGRRATLNRVLAALDIGLDDFAAIFELPAASSIDELCAGRVDATLLIVGHPNGAVARALSTCGATLIPLQGPQVEAVLHAGSEYVPLTIARSTYPELRTDVPTFSVMATLVTRSDIDADIVEAVVAETLRTLPALAMRAPVLAGLDPVRMRSTGLSAPLHPGAAAAFADFDAEAAKP